jgi:apolipoprotein N-acyltransferase
MAQPQNDTDQRRIKFRKQLRFAGLVWGIIAVGLLIFWAFGGFHSMGLTIAGAIALILGILGTCALAIGLMALIFYSDISNADEDAYHFKPAQPPRPKDEP